MVINSESAFDGGYFKVCYLSLCPGRNTDSVKPGRDVLH